MVIDVIAVERELHTNYYLFIANVLVTNFFGVEKYLSYRNICTEISIKKYRNIYEVQKHSSHSSALDILYIA